MNNILATRTCRAIEHADGLKNVVCPLCLKTISQLDICYFGENGSNHEIECCCDCVEEFENESGTEITSDMLDKPVFSAFWKYAQACVAEQKQSDDDATRVLLAEALGGYIEWKAGKWFIPLHRPDGRIVTVSTERVCEYADEQSFAEDNPVQVVNLV